MDLRRMPHGSTHWGDDCDDYSECWYKKDADGVWWLKHSFKNNWELHVEGVSRPVTQLIPIYPEKEIIVSLKEVKPTVVRTFKFSTDQIKNLIADELDFDRKTVKISFNLDHNDMVKDIQIEVKQ